MRPYRTKLICSFLAGAVVSIVVPFAYGAHYVDDGSSSAVVKTWYARAIRSDMTPATSPCRQVPLDVDACQRGKPQGKTASGPGSSCCGEADAYWADSYKIKDGEFYAVVTDDRIVPGRPVVSVGTEILIPQANLDVYRQGNPTGHAIVFLAGGQYPICYFFSTGG